MTRPSPAPNLPTYALYGEHGRTQATDWLHCETIRERSQRHAWEIKAHRHESLFQILHIHGGRAEALLEGATERLEGPCVLTVAALAPHGFRFDEDIDGTVITVLERHLAQLLSGAGTLAARVMRSQTLAWQRRSAGAKAVAGAVAAVREEFFGTAPWRDLKLDAALLALAVELGRALPMGDQTAPEAAGERALSHVKRFRALVEAQFREQPTLSALARQLGITPTQLNRACHQVLGHSALGVLHSRLMLEAQRDLAYTTLGIKQIALGLGFNDAGYFTRFFQREAGLTPTAWRAQALR
ncbi:helix-turn-helix domain-containing protein [Aquincola sp. S2]|uniref:Helix-turn-helix domain-containing protein n=1 Tax=Pseudaquabacterium terrae TaxID=2732868 RepID=A0ABX2EAN9_9BURK|nr:helix-turn-helix domain-containing protein [Aquabacterium terrae]NRF66155.1 helix-turn-helix domain-containing protein [Aquabacterium terrae]